MTAPQISVIMAAYNVSNYLQECIHSVLQQKDISYECVIVDDASTDSTSKILAHYCKQHGDIIRVFRNEANKERCISRNRAIAEARSDLIAVMDADDWAYPVRLQRQVAFMNAHRDIVVCGSRAEAYETGEFLPCPRTHDEIKATMLFTSPFVHSSVVFRRSMVGSLAGGYDPKMPPAEDFDLWARLAQHPETRFHNLPETLIRYRIHPGQDRNAYAARQKGLALGICLRLLESIGVRCGAHKRQALSLFRDFSEDSSPDILRQLSALLEEICAACARTGYAAPDAAGKILGDRWLRLVLYLIKRHPLLAAHAMSLPATRLHPDGLVRLATLVKNKLWRPQLRPTRGHSGANGNAG